MSRLLLLLLACTLALCSCGGSSGVKEVTYNELGAEFLPQIIERFTVATDQPLECKMVHVLWTLEAHMPPQPNVELSPDDSLSVLCLCEGTYTGTGKEAWRLFQMNRAVKEGKVVWNQAFRVDTTNEGEYTGARRFTQKPTVEQLNRFVERARLKQEIAYRCQMLEYTKTKSHMYYIEAKAYPEECYELFGSTPACLKEVTLLWHANEPKPNITLPAETKRSGFLDEEE